ncbi:Gfo/Idh/MocA family oxidoreductase [Mediterraneibacter sp. NSJ-55]|uniref:Gfo/Idh/MocA family oxidoreductase n=1 Tax=Mediterraneibacter hominis TaxID=2763054 RepID=A0A923LMF4_9FIRM|nr:Gfo/Idh/MocA family oxidoreductase [Mediterraneibacter hominis]MBC5690606.1 Gfo/Idh/MocA family oxidoreductase [Mediterraneibacter hominis]
MKHLRMALIGAGQIAQATHIPNYISMPEVELAGICDVRIETARKAADAFHIPQYFDSSTKMLRELKPDAVTVCVPNKFHYQTVMEALNRGCHVLCEKPPAITAEEAEQMEKKAHEKGCLLSYGFHLRSSEEVQFLHRAIEQGTLGELYHVEVKWRRRRGIPGWGNFIDKEIQGGGPLIDIGAHVLDSALYLLDYPRIDYVCAASSNRIGKTYHEGLMGKWNPEKFTVEDGLFGFVKFKNGCSLEIQTSFALNQKEKDIRNILLYGDRSGAQLFPLEIYGEEAGRLYDKTFPFTGQKDLHLELDRNFVQACLGRETLLVKPWQGTYIQSLIGILYESAETGRPVVCDKKNGVYSYGTL